LKMRLKILSALGWECRSCGLKASQNNLNCFDVHHVGTKTIDMKDAYKHSWDKVSKELECCELLCAVCHRLQHKNIIGQEMYSVALRAIEKSL